MHEMLTYASPLGLKNGILVRDKDTGEPLHVLPNQYLLYRGDTKHHFPNNNLSEGSATAEIGKSFTRAYRHKNARLKKAKQKPQSKTQITNSFTYTEALTILMLMMAPLESLKVYLRTNLFYCPNLNNYHQMA